jgi:hypothetical protein
VLGLALYSKLSPADLSALSASSLDRALDHDVELYVAAIAGRATILGALQRSGDAPPEPGTDAFARASGGAAARVSPGVVWVSLLLPSPSALADADESQILNRYVRPLLKGLTRAGALAHYFGRDWISVGHRPAGLVGFAHDAATKRTAFEAFVAVADPVDAPGVTRASYMDKELATLSAIAGKPLATADVVEAIGEAYADAHPDHEVAPFDKRVPGPLRPEDAPPWRARVDEAMGPVCAGADASGRVRLGGEWMVSRDALAALESDVAALGAWDEDAVAAAVDRRLAAPGVALFGVRSLDSIRAALREAYKNPK